MPRGEVRIRVTDREFSPAEAAHITRVDPQMQRAWRHRGILREKADLKWSRFSLEGLIELAALRIFSDNNEKLHAAVPAAQMAVGPVLDFLRGIPEAVSFEGVTLSERQQAMARRALVCGVEGRYIVFADGVRAQRYAVLPAMSELTNGEPVFRCSLLDCAALAQAIFENIGEPLIIVTATENLNPSEDGGEAASGL